MDETKEVDKEEEQQLAILQQKITQLFYVHISKMFEDLSSELFPGEIAEIVISAMAVNLGTLIGQCPDDYRDKVMKQSKRMMDNSCLMTVKHVSQQTYGKIGHA